MLTERDMEDAIVEDAQRYLGEAGLKLVSRQHHIGSYVFDLLFEDRHGGRLIVELQRGTLDRVHTYKILDYYHEYKSSHPREFVDLMVVANQIPIERKQRLTDGGIAFREIPMSEFPEPVTSQTHPAPKCEKSTQDASSPVHFSDISKEAHMPSNNYPEFWRGLLNQANKRTNLFSEVRPSEKQLQNHWLERRVKGLSGVTFNFAVYPDKSKVELRMQGSLSENEDIMRSLYPAVTEIERVFGGRLDWDWPKPGERGGQRGKIMSQPTSPGLDEKERWGELQKDLVDRMLRLIAALRGRGSLPVNF